ncbi:hypothetical protein Syun_021704 [Stephania yunnanensis]|uniref:Uncharacterized protein n=1 Tax=Stephania yunnanensis TaxID=152371 RepID=A0AAP0NPD5_9MAGN
MDSEKRKRQSNGTDNGRRTKAKAEEEQVTEKVTEKTDAEVEEFFAILRRLHSAVRDYKRDNGPNGDVRDDELTEEMKMMRKRPSWKPSFEWGDFEGLNGAVTSRREEGEEEGYVLDLNADPKS